MNDFLGSYALHTDPIVRGNLVSVSVCQFVSVSVGTLSSFVEDENENKIMTWHALRHWDENIVFGAKIES